ncbi:MAG: Glu/Leu/Phe/Val dehydrogenase [Gammaproteobacteria bacterium]|jgi:leucine dehydrogenase|nr:Glu/Leu/Phe/Val dehydrogenase [Gammaproteobacteria bacterium]MBT3860171.1 Glu/Leu/Phe/Val dehydrogenase [Gammaproteobacteria bacterium]MBT3987463.1 Glu/Leu/Phe/Val dehydrogenase [Gammaproteobacteria bacterium]MBT4581799.1 Glu/Leu/Phe/Val dehydrogenase [Gammaproteobacteria bacterium]MBT4659659.1 Glu/Leu/Phe/Val dehydrogenase [Gammaproteobacteria bacterium]
MEIKRLDVSQHPEFDDHEELAECRDQESGLHAFIAIHNRKLGPALGGCRMWPYADREEAITDVLRLSRGMTYKSAISNLALGGGKAVIIGDPKKDKSDELLRAMGSFVNSLSGRFVTAEDSGTTVPDIQLMAQSTDHVAGIRYRAGAYGVQIDGDPSPFTAYGVFVGMKTSVRHKLGKSNMKDLRVAIQGVGNVGRHLAKLLVEDGAKVYVADLYPAAIAAVLAECSVVPVEIEDIHKLDVDVFAPCALGGIINQQLLEEIKARIIVGAANNQLVDSEMGDKLQKAGMLYAPDYLVNSGGIIDIFYERGDYDFLKVRHHIEEIGETLHEIYKESQERGIATNKVADRIAESRFKGE